MPGLHKVTEPSEHVCRPQNRLH